MKDSAEDETAHAKMMLLMDIHKEAKECTTLEMILERLVATDEQTRKEVLKLMKKMAGASVEPSLLATPTKSQTYSVVIKTPAEAPSKKPTTPESARPAAPTSTQPTGPPPGPPLPPPSLKSVRGPPPLPSG